MIPNGDAIRLQGQSRIGFGAPPGLGGGGGGGSVGVESSSCETSLVEIGPPSSILKNRSSVTFKDSPLAVSRQQQTTASSATAAAGLIQSPVGAGG